MYIYNSLIIGTGAAGYAAADALHRCGVKNIAILTNGKNAGTSRNTGSDKQTYYKPSQDGQTSDCAAALAEDYTRGGCCDGVLAYLEGTNSLRCFYRLLELGVPFPQDEYGAFPSYMTDHDKGGRATSIGPLTSKVMVECLEKQVLDKNRTVLLDNLQVVKILKNEGRAAGVLALNKNGEFIRALSQNVIFATGAPADIYAQSVYPQSQRGAAGVLIEAGVRLVNFCEWQYGIASVGFRWNLSGSYMQSIPHVYSQDADGNQHNFLHNALGDKTASTIFYKGPQWPFDVQKIDSTSRIDLLVQAETSAGRRVYLDYRRNPTDYSFNALSKDIRAYFIERSAAADTPIERLSLLNPKAIELFRSNGVDLTREPLEMAVCAQHNNGGVLVDEHCQSDVPGLYVIGEAAGIFGLTRPGGSALNSTQVTALRAAAHISGQASGVRMQENVGVVDVTALLAQIAKLNINADIAASTISSKMSRCASFIRNRESMMALLEEIDSLLQNQNRPARSVSEFFYELDMLRSARAMLISVLQTMKKTGSRGGALYMENGSIVPENKQYRNCRAVTYGDAVEFIPLRSVPSGKTVFESVDNPLAKRL